MSLLEDVFLQDEADEAQELERVIDGDENDEQPRSDDSDENSAKEDEAEEEKIRVDPTEAKPKKIVKNPRFILNPARLTGPRGIQIIPEHFKDFKFKGKGHEKEDLDLLLKKLEHWAYRLYPKFEFEDCLKKIETLGKKRPVMVHLHKIRTDQFTSEETVVQHDSSDNEEPQVQEDEFDKLLQQQIELARSTPAPSSAKKAVIHQNDLIEVKATSSPSISDEQRERMIQNRRLAEERRLARLKKLTDNDNTVVKETPIVHIDSTSEINRSDDINNIQDLRGLKSPVSVTESHDHVNNIDDNSPKDGIEINAAESDENTDVSPYNINLIEKSEDNDESHMGEQNNKMNEVTDCDSEINLVQDVDMVETCNDNTNKISDFNTDEDETLQDTNVINASGSIGDKTIEHQSVLNDSLNIKSTNKNIKTNEDVGKTADVAAEDMSDNCVMDVS